MLKILTHFSGKTCHLGSRVGETCERGEIVGTPLTVGSGRSLTQSDEICEWRDRRDSNPKSSDAQSQSEKGIPPLSPEALTLPSTLRIKFGNLNLCKNIHL